MQSVQAAGSLPAQSNNVDSVPFQDAALDIWCSKYRLKDSDGRPIDTDFRVFGSPCRS